MAHRLEDRSEVRWYTFAMRVNAQERQMLGALAQKLKRSRSDVVRLLVREALLELERDEKEADNGT
jgi:hypothetical protein